MTHSDVLFSVSFSFFFGIMLSSKSSRSNDFIRKKKNKSDDRINMKEARRSFPCAMLLEKKVLKYQSER